MGSGRVWPGDDPADGRDDAGFRGRQESRSQVSGYCRRVFVSIATDDCHTRVLLIVDRRMRREAARGAGR